MRLKLFANSLLGKLLLVLAVLFCISYKSHSGKRGKKAHKVLVFSKTNGFRHGSIPKGIEAIKKLGQENAFYVDATED